MYVLIVMFLTHRSTYSTIKPIFRLQSLHHNLRVLYHSKRHCLTSFRHLYGGQILFEIEKQRQWINTLCCNNTDRKTHLRPHSNHPFGLDELNQDRISSLSLLVCLIVVIQLDAGELNRRLVWDEAAKVSSSKVKLWTVKPGPNIIHRRFYIWRWGLMFFSSRTGCRTLWDIYIREWLEAHYRYFWEIISPPEPAKFSRGHINKNILKKRVRATA